MQLPSSHAILNREDMQLKLRTLFGLAYPELQLLYKTQLGQQT